MIDRRNLIRYLLSEGYIIVGRESYDGDPNSRAWMMHPVTGRIRYLPKDEKWDTPSASRLASDVSSPSVSILTKSLLSESLPQMVPSSLSAEAVSRSFRRSGNNRA